MPPATLAKRLSVALGTLAAALALAACGAAEDSTQPPAGKLLIAPESADAAIRPAAPRSAEAFVDSIGVNVHTAYSDTPYRDFGQVSQRLGELGIHHVRDNLEAEEPGSYADLRALSDQGIESTLIMGRPENGIDGLEGLIETLEAELPEAVDAVEGPNELDISGDPDWQQSLTDYQRELYQRIESSPTLSELPVVGPSIAHLRTVPAAPDLEPYLDFGNIHSYSGGEPPEPLLATWILNSRRISGEKPLYATETGYHNAIGSDAEHPPASEQATAVYLPRIFLDYFANGVVRTFAYELLDEHPDPGRDEPESNFGLLREDFSPKPAFETLRNLIAILEDPGGAEFEPAPLSYSLTGVRADLRQLLLGKRDGGYWLALWRAGSVWDPVAKERVEPGSAPVTVRFERELDGSAVEYQPNESADPIGELTVRGGREVEVRVGTRVVIVAIETAADGDPG